MKNNKLFMPFFRVRRWESDFFVSFWFPYFASLVFTFFICSETYALDIFPWDCEVDGLFFKLNKDKHTACTTAYGYSYVNPYSQYPKEKVIYIEERIYIPYPPSNICQGVIIIPSQIVYQNETYIVDSIGKYTFQSANNLYKVIVPETVKSVGERAFAWSSVFSVKLGQNVKMIGNMAFYMCSNLTEINIPTGVTEIGGYAFSQTGLLSATIPTGVKEVMHNLFYKCASLRSVKLPSTLQNIGNSAFDGCSSLEAISIPGTVEKIGRGAFTGCSCLTKVILEDSPKVMLVNAFTNYSYPGAFWDSPIVDLYIGRNMEYDEVGYSSLGVSPLSIKKVTIGENVTQLPCIFKSTSTNNKCIIYSYADTPPGYGYDLSNISSVHVLSVAYEAYKNHVRWGNCEIICDIDDDLINLVNTVLLNRSDLQLLENRQYALTTKILPEDATIKTLSWTSSDESIATVSNGVISAIKPGNVVITATTTDGSNITAKCNLTVTAQPSATFDFTRPLKLSPAIEPAEDEDDAVNIGNKVFANNKVNVSLCLGTRSNYSARLWTLAGGSCELRTYSGATLTIEVPANHHIKSIMLNGSKNDVFKTTVGTFSNGIWSGDEQKVVFNCTGTSNLTSIVVDYDAPIVYSIVDGEEYTNTSEEYYDRVEYTRNYSNKNWQAFYVPFSMNYDDWKNDYELAKINDVNMYDTDSDGEVDETEIEIIVIKKGLLKPNHPYMIKAKGTGVKTLSLIDATIYPRKETSVDVSSAEMKFTFTGTYSGVSGDEMMDGHYYAMAGGELCYTDNNQASLKPYRWYMKVESRDPQVILPSKMANVRVRVVGEDVEATEIAEVETETESAVAPVYALDGRVVSKDGSREGLGAGIYIKNGKKFIVK